MWALPAALLLLPSVDFVAYDDPRMVRTTDAIRRELERGGLLLRYQTEETDDGLPGQEGSFIACTFWLAECLARQGRRDAARRRYDRAMDAATPLGLFSEEYDTGARCPLGNFPQALTHLAQIAAGRALDDA